MTKTHVVKMLKSFLLIFTLITIFKTDLSAQCNRPAASDNPCTAPYFCNTAQLGRYCSSTGTPVAGRNFMRPRGFCGTIENPQWFRFIAESASLELSFNANSGLGCGGHGVQAAIFEATSCSDSATYTLKSNCINAMGGQPIGAVTATGLVAGQTYYMLVDGYQGQSCTYQIQVVNGTIRLTTDPLPTPSVISGLTSVCENATNITYSVPKTPNASEYHFVVTRTTDNTVIFDGNRTDSFYTVAAFGAAGTNYRVCVSYRNDCGAEGTPRCVDVSVSTGATVTLPNVFLCPGSFYELPDGNIVDNTTPPNADETQVYSAQKTGSGGCDTTFNVSVTRYIHRTANRVLFLKPTESIAVCSQNLSIPVNTCPRLDRVISCRGAAVNGCDSLINTTLINAKQTLTFSPTNPVLNCNSVILQINTGDTCVGVRHLESYRWFFQANAGDPLSSQGVNSASLIVTTAGIYTVIVRDSVFLSSQPALGYRIMSDTFSVTVTGSGATGSLPIPNLINGRADTTVCQGATAIYRINSVAGATTYNWTLARNGGTITRINDTTISVQWAGNTSGDTIYVIAQGACSVSPRRGLAVLIINFANLDAGADRSVCGLSAQLNASSSIGTGTWSVASGSAGTATFDDATIPNAQITPSVSGVYKLVWKETFNTCEKTDTVQMTFNLLPRLTSIVNVCNAARTHFSSTLTISAFATLTILAVPSNTVLGNLTTVPNNIGSTTLAFPVGSHTIRFRDGNGCSVDSTITENCPPIVIACTTQAGNMETTTTLNVCQGDTARAVYLGGYVNDGNDTLQFVLHSGNPRSNIIARSNTPRFAYRAGLNFNQVYFISAIAGNDSARNVKLLDTCLSISAGTPVIFRPRPTATVALSDPSLCAGTCTNLRYTLTGRAPFVVTTRFTDSTTRDSVIGNMLTGNLLRICPTVATTYRMVAVRDSFGCIDSTLTQNVRINVFQPVKAGTALPPLSICGNLDTLITLSTLLTNPTAGGTWSEVSEIPSNGGVFNRTNGTFRTRAQAVGVYKFAYVVRPPVGSPCPNDTALVAVEILFAPTSCAGSDDTIKCFVNKRSIQIGGSCSSAGPGIGYRWSGPNLNGNTQFTRVSSPGTYVLEVANGTCTARDTVIIRIDTISPVANIAAVVDTITCKSPLVQLDGSRSTPFAPQITYDWMFAGGNIDNNAITQAVRGGRYALRVTMVRNGCTATDSAFVQENTVLPTISIGTPPTINCKDTIVTIDASASSSGSQYQIRWKASNGGRFLSDSTTLTPKTKSSGIYQLLLTDLINGCVDSSFRFVPIDSVQPRAVAIATDTLDCANQTVGLSGRGSSLSATTSFSWVARPGNIISGATSLNPVVSDAGVYILTVQNDKNFCFATDTVEVFRNSERPRGFVISKTKPTCFGECDAQFKADSIIGGTAPYLYSLDGKVFTTRNLFPNQCAGKIQLFVQDAGGCSLDTTFTIIQDPQISVSLGADTTIKLGDSLLLTVQTNAASIKKLTWSPNNDSTQCPKTGPCIQRWVRPIVGTTYTVTVTDSNGCASVGRVNISIDKKAQRIFVPTVFSPNNDGANDILFINGSGAVRKIKRFQIFDRWGEQVFAAKDFSPNDPSFGWDGRIKNRDASPAIYIYYLEVEYQDNTTAILEGDVALMR